MSKPVKEMIIESYRQRFGDAAGAVLVDLRGIDANTNNALRQALAAKGIRITMVKNSLARQAVDGTALEPLRDMIDGSCAFVYGAESVVEVARALVEHAKDIEDLDFHGALLEEQVFGSDEIDRLSKFPTRDEAIADVLTLLVSPGRTLAGQVAAPGRKLAGLLKALEERAEG
ncbi:MAG: 50S ribosomal protein L10 [Phycisphaeraceae bacterium]|nr:50S ribosomal protein L10 [Phycisphaeraceae bacterium]